MQGCAPGSVRRERNLFFVQTGETALCRAASPEQPNPRRCPCPKGRNRDAYPARSAKSPLGGVPAWWPHSKARVAAAEWGRRGPKKNAQRQPSPTPRRPSRPWSSADAEPLREWRSYPRAAAATRALARVYPQGAPPKRLGGYARSSSRQPVSPGGCTGGASLQVAANHLYNESPTSPAPNVGLPPRSSRPRRYAANVGLLPRSSRSRDAPRPKGRNRDAHPARSAQSPLGGAP